MGKDDLGRANGLGQTDQKSQADQKSHEDQDRLNNHNITLNISTI